MQRVESQNGSSSWHQGISSTSTRRLSKHKSYLTSQPSGSKPNCQERQMCPTLGPCISTGRRKMKAQASSSYHQKATSFAMSYKWDSNYPPTTRLSTKP